MKRFIIGAVISFTIFILLLLFVFQPIDSIKDLNAAPDITILDRNEEPIMHFINYHKTTPIDLSQLSEKNKNILLTIEDKDFYKHSGFHFARIITTLFSNFKNQTSYGASTITQQYVKNIYFGNQKTMSRKIKEIYYAIKLEQVATKDEILASYLNCIYLGNDVYGLVNGSLYYFNKSYTDLSIAEMVTLVALLNAPTYYSSHINALNQKKNQLLAILLEEKTISNIEYDEALNPIQFHINTHIYPSNLLFYVDTLIQEYQSFHIQPSFQESVQIKTRYHHGVNQHVFDTTGDYAYEIIDKDGYIISMVGGKDYYQSSYNITTQGNRDIGSTIKPILYYEALKCGFSPSTSFYSAPYTFSYHNEEITIKNNASIYPYNKIKMKEALATSDNIYAIKMHQALGFKTLANHFKQYNINALPLPSLALGSVGMSLQQLISIYSQFFQEGIYLKQRFIEVIKVNHKKIYQAQIKKTILGTPSYYKQIKEMMHGLFDISIPHATASGIGSLLKSKCYGKSGLTDFDSYMIGFNEDILIGIWSGYLDNQKLENNNIKRLPKEIFLKLMNSYS